MQTVRAVGSALHKQALMYEELKLLDLDFL